MSRPNLDWGEVKLSRFKTFCTVFAIVQLRALTMALFMMCVLLVPLLAWNADSVSTTAELLGDGVSKVATLASTLGWLSVGISAVLALCGSAFPKRTAAIFTNVKGSADVRC